MEFEWDSEKAASNLRKHGVAFDEAALVFRDIWNIDRPDAEDWSGEDRQIVIGLVKQAVLTVVMTERHGRIRLISARSATIDERTEYWENRSLHP